MRSFQDEAIPSLLSKHDLFAQVPAGTGEEAAYALTVIERVVSDGPTYNPTALILVPTRELAIQVHEVIFQLSSRGAVANVLGVFEGKPITSQIGPLKHGVDIVVGTPGRVLEHVKRKTLRIEQLKILVLDRADEMLDQGLGRELEVIIGETPKKTRQTVIFSSSIPQRVVSMARDHLRDPVLIGIEPEALEFDSTADAPRLDLTNLYFGAGKSAGVTPRDLVGAITNEGGLIGEQIGAIKIKENFSLVAVPAEAADDIVRKLRTSRIKGRKVTIRLERFGSKKAPRPR
ncbi:MAG: DEAD/DEAH box helicase [Thermoleophilia bacterium]|nr:DEAD/DEAH box helicase [Thermoleophilia bacterium]